MKISEKEEKQNLVRMETRFYVEAVMRDIYNQDLSEAETIALCVKIQKTIPPYNL